MHREEKGKHPQRVPRGLELGLCLSLEGRGQGWWHCQHTGDSSRSWPMASTERKGFCQQHKAGLSWQQGTNKSSQKVHEDLTFPLGETKREIKKEQEKDILEMI